MSSIGSQPFKEPSPQPTAPLLSVTDNIVNGQVVHPEGVRTPDGDDPYFVVAADKGTATFSDIANALAAQNVLTPVGTQKIDSLEYTIQLNSAPSAIAELARLPVKFSPQDEMVQLPDLEVAAMSLASLSLSLNPEGDKSDE